MIDFAFLPPEINSSRMYAGPGAGPMLAAATAWSYLADELYLSAVAYSGAIADLTSSWIGPSSVSMSGAAGTYVSWITATAAQAEQAAVQATAAVAAYEAAFGMTVPPAVIAANRALLMALVATNFFGQNTPAIMATEAEYIEMWVQDSVAMYTYAGASTTASTLTPFTPPADTTTTGGSSGGLAGVAAAAAQAVGATAGTGAQMLSTLTTAMSSALETFASTVTSYTTSISPLTSLATSTTTMATGAATTSGTMITSSTAAVTSGTTLASGTASSASMLTSAVSMLGSSGSLAHAAAPVTSSFGGGFPMFQSSPQISPTSAAAWGSPAVGDFEIAATSGRAASLGALSVPQSWTSAAPAFSQVASALPGGSSLPATTPVTTAGSASPLSTPLANAAESRTAGSPLAARYNYRPPMVQRPVYAG